MSGGGNNLMVKRKHADRLGFERTAALCVLPRKNEECAEHSISRRRNIPL